MSASSLPSIAPRSHRRAPPFTGQRRGEIAALRRTWINTKDHTITLPTYITKTGFEHRFPYGPAAATVLKKIDAASMDESDYLFPASRGHVRGKPTTTFNGWPKSKEAFDQACGVSGRTLHDVRRTVAAGLAALEVPPNIIERLLNHKFGSLQNQTADGLVTAVAEIYNLVFALAFRFPFIEEPERAWQCHRVKAVRTDRNNDIDRTCVDQLLADFELSPRASAAEFAITSPARPLSFSAE